MNAEHVKTLLEQIAITCELTGTTLSDPAARVLAQDLLRYPMSQIIAALARCRRELTGRLTLAAIITRLDDGRPGPEEAWATIPRNEATSIVWTDEMAQAWGTAATLLDEGDPIAARMAFLERYRGLVQRARDNGMPPHWTPSLGTDPHGRMHALEDAVTRGRISQVHAISLLPAVTDRIQPQTKLLSEIMQRANVEPKQLSLANAG